MGKAGEKAQHRPGAATMNKAFQTALKIAVSGALLWFIVNRITLDAVVEALKAADVKYAIPIVAVFLLSFAIKAANYRLLTAAAKNISFAKLLKISMLSWAAGMFAPGKLGEFSAIYFLKKEGVPLGAATAASILDKLITISTLIVIAAIGLLTYIDTVTAIKVTATAAVAVAAAVMLIIAPQSRLLIRKFILRKYESRFAGFSEYFFGYIKEKKLLLLYNYGLALLWTYASAVMIWLGLLSVGIKAPVTTILLINSASIIVSIIPVTVGGLGARETAAVLLFEKAGYAAAPILGGYLVITIVSNLLALLVSVAAVAGKK